MQRAYLELHIAVLLFGFTAILGRLITLDAVPLVWWRVLITAASLLVFAQVRSAWKTIPSRRIVQFLVTGCILALHWVTFFLAIKLSNVSVALVAFATQSIFTSIVDPLITRRSFHLDELTVGAVIIPAMALIVDQLDASMHLGIWIGVISAVLIAVFSSITKNLITTARPLQITYFQMTGAWLFLCLLGPFWMNDVTAGLLPRGADIPYVLVLALLCTTFAYVLAIRSLRYLTAFSSNLANNLEPIYGIVLAIVIFRENDTLSDGFYIGAVIILVAVFSHPLIRHMRAKQ